MPHAAPSDANVHAWYARTSALADFANTTEPLAWLEPAEHDRYQRFRSENDRAMFLVGRIMSRALVGRELGVAPSAWRWREGAHGRPEIASPSTPLQFNLAHSAGLVVCAIGRGRDVGVDVEDLGRRPVDRALVDRYCAPSEIIDVELQGDAWHTRFLHYWTLKEAYLKARGLGIAVPLADIAFTLGPAPRIDFIGTLAGADTRWHFDVRQPTERHLVAVAVSTSDGATPHVTLEPFAWSAVGS